MQNRFCSKYQLKGPNPLSLESRPFLALGFSWESVGIRMAAFEPGERGCSLAGVWLRFIAVGDSLCHLLPLNPTPTRKLGQLPLFNPEPCLEDLRLSVESWVARGVPSHTAEQTLLTFLSSGRLHNHLDGTHLLAAFYLKGEGPCEVGTGALLLCHLSC